MGQLPRSDTVAVLGLTQVLHTPGRLLISCRFPGSLLPLLEPSCLSLEKSPLVLRAAMHLPSCPQTLPLALAREAEANRLSPEPRRPFDYISRCKQAGRGRATVPRGWGWSSVCPTQVCFIPSFQLASAFCSFEWDREQLGGWGKAGVGSGAWVAP